MKSIVFNLRTGALDERPVYLVGNFNNWTPQDENYRMLKIGAGIYRLEFEFINIKLPIEYKYTRGAWNQVEVDRFGNPLANRKISNKRTSIDDFVANWQINGRSYDRYFMPIIEVISHDFEIPQLIKTRRIAALLPFDYYETKRRYPVLYLQDGQNLFDDHAPFGSWGVDKKLAILQKIDKGDVIIIAIDHAEEERIKEYNPTSNQRLEQSEGMEYVNFLVNSLKPYIDANFRTKPEREFTGLGGSSMGGLISLWGGFKFPSFYSKLMIFSPALWVNPKIYLQGNEFLQYGNSKMYIYAGGDESDMMLPQVRTLVNGLNNDAPRKNAIMIRLEVDPKGKHNERKWGMEFPKALVWLFEDQYS